MPHLHINPFLSDNTLPRERRPDFPGKGFAVANPDALAAERFRDGGETGGAEFRRETGKLRAALLHLDQAELPVD